jgi:hypothetical protein
MKGVGKLRISQKFSKEEEAWMLNASKELELFFLSKIRKRVNYARKRFSLRRAWDSCHAYSKKKVYSQQPLCT